MSRETVRVVISATDQVPEARVEVKESASAPQLRRSRWLVDIVETTVTRDAADAHRSRPAREIAIAGNSTI